MPSGVNPDIADARTSDNLKVLADEWLALGAHLAQTQKVFLLNHGCFRQPDEPLFHAPGGFVDQWRDLAARHAAALAAARSAGHEPVMLTRWANPPHDDWVLCFATAALGAKPAG